MALQTAAGSFAVAATNTISGLPFAPKAVLFFSTGQLSDATGAEQFGTFGAGTSGAAADQRAAGWHMTQNVSTTSSFKWWQSGIACNNVDPVATTLTGLTSDGFTTAYTGSSGTGQLVQYLAIGGSDVTNAKVASWSNSLSGASTGNQSITNVGFKPDLVILFGASSTALVGNTAAAAQFSLGVARGAANRWCMAMNVATGATMTSGVLAKRTQRTDSCLVGLTTASAQDFRADLVSMDADGFTINWIDAPATASLLFGYLALKGGTYEVGAAAKPTGAATANQDVIVGFPVSGLFLESWNIAASTTITSDTKFSLGFSDNIFTQALIYGQNSIWGTQTDAVLPTVTNRAMTRQRALTLRTSPSTVDAEAQRDPVTLTAQSTGNTTTTQGITLGTNSADIIAQSFNDTSGMIGAVDFTATRTGNPTDSLVCELRADSGGSPGAVLATATTFAASSVPTSPAIVKFLFQYYNNPPVLQNGTTYWVTVRRTGAADASNYYTFWYDPNTDIYTTGMGKYWWASGSSWQQLGIVGTTYDFYFVIYTQSLPSVTNGFRLAWNPNNAVAAEICYLAMGSNIPNAIDGNRVSWPDHLNSNVGPTEVSTTTAPDQTRFISNAHTTLGVTANLAQSFTPSTSYTISSIGVGVQKSGAPTDSITVQIQSDNAGVPSGTVLASATIPPGSVTATGDPSGWATVALSLAVTAGTLYWIVLITPASNGAALYAWSFGSSQNTNATPDIDAYPSGGSSNAGNNGSWFAPSNLDYAFRISSSVAQSSSTRLYAILLDKNGNKLRCYKSIDSGATWAVQDYANSPASSTTANYKSVDCHLSGTTIYCYKPVSATSMTIEQFDTSTDTWGTQIAGPTITLNTDNNGIVGLFGVRRSDGSFVIAYDGAIWSTRRAVKLHYRTSGGVWNGPYDVLGSANSPVANTDPNDTLSWDVKGALLGVSDRVHILLNQNQAHIASRSFLSGNTFGSRADINQGVTASQQYPFGLGTLNGSELVLPVRAVSSTNSEVSRSTDADSPSWVNTVHSIIQGGTITIPGAGVAVVNVSTVYILWLGTSRNIYLHNDGGNNNWGTDLLWKAITCNGISAGKITNAIGVCYNEQVATGLVFPKYDSYSLDSTLPYSIFGMPYGYIGSQQMAQLIVQ